MRIAIALCFVACGGSHNTLPNTTVPNTEANRRAITVVEDARIALEGKQFARLEELADDNYMQCFKRGEPCIGKSSIVELIVYRFEKAKMDFSMHYDRVTRVGDKTFVDVTLDVQIHDEYGVSHIQRPHTYVVRNATSRITSGMLPPGADPGPRDDAKTRAAFSRKP